MNDDPGWGMAPSQRIRWALAGFGFGFVASLIVGAIVIAVGGYDPDVAAGVGSDLGRTAMQAESGSEFDDGRVPIHLIALIQVPLWGGLLGAALSARRDGLSWDRDIRWRMSPVDVPVGIVTGVVLQLVLIPLLYVPIFWIFGDQDVEGAARSLIGPVDGPAEIITLVLMTVVGAALVEEIFFRGLVQGALADQHSAPAAIAGSAVVFAAIHLQLLQFPALLLVGLVHGLLVARSGRLAPAVWSHVAFNATTVFLLLTT